MDKRTTQAAALWAGWEKKESGWQRKVVDYGNQALKRIPYEEWGLKSIPPLSKRKELEELSSTDKVEVSFPSTLIPDAKVMDILRTMGTERQSLHKSRMIYSFVGMPIVAPFALVPMYVHELSILLLLIDILLVYRIFRFFTLCSELGRIGGLSPAHNISNFSLTTSF